MTLHLSDVDVGKLAKLLNACRGLTGSELKKCVYRVVNESKSPNHPDGRKYIDALSLCGNPFWILVRSASGKVYIAYNPTLSRLFIATQSFVESFNDVNLLLSRAAENLGEPPYRVAMHFPRKGMGIRGKVGNANSAIETLARILAIAITIACID